MSYSDKLIALMFPKPLLSPGDWENKYPRRQLPNGAIVTRFGPSPTGFMHIGGVYIATIGKNLAHHSDGIFFVRIEDTDQNRKVDDFQFHFDQTFRYFDIESDERDDNAKWGPYTQSKRSDIYLSHVKYLTQINRAYPCFCTKEQLQEQSDKQRSANVDIGYYGPWAPCRDLNSAEVERRIKAGMQYVMRFRSLADATPMVFNDLIRGEVKATDNINDVVILKSSSNILPLPTYHLAHAVDDHLMRVNLVLRSDEWLPSVTLHFQLFDALGFQRIPYAHIAPLMKIDGKSRRKLSKRKDPEASVVYYMEQGYPAKAVVMYLKGLANSRLADCTVESGISEPIHLNELQKSGALIDMEKLKFVSANYIATMTASEIRDNVFNWASEYDAELSHLIKNNWDYVNTVIDADRFNNGKTRKDLYRWMDFSSLYSFFFSGVFQLIHYSGNELLEKYPENLVQNLAAEFVKNYRESSNNADWFENIKQIADVAKFAVNNKDYKLNPESFAGTISDASQILRVAITGRTSSPNLYDVCNILGKDEILKRVGSLSK